MKKRMISLLLSLVFVFTLLPTAVLAANEYSLSEDGTLTLTPDNLVDGASGEGWSFDGNLTIQSGYRLIFDGECWYTVHNHGTIVSGTFGDYVHNHGTIEDGTFNQHVFNHGTIEGGSFDGEVTNYSTIKGGTFNHEVFNRYLISGGTFTQQVTNDGTIENGSFNFNVANNESGTIKDGSFSVQVENRGTIEGGNFSGSVNNNRNATISGGVFTGGLFNPGTVTGMADLSGLRALDNNNGNGRYGKDVKLPKVVIRGDLTYTGCDPTTQITLHYYADDVKTAEWKVSGEKYSYRVEKYKRTDPDADLSAIKEITHEVKADPMEGYEITIENPIWDRFNVTVAYIPELTITGISDGDSFHVGTEISFQALGRGTDDAPLYENKEQWRAFYWQVADSSGAVVVSGRWGDEGDTPLLKQYPATFDTENLAEGQYTLTVYGRQYNYQSGVWVPYTDAEISENVPGKIAARIKFSLTHNYGTEWESDGNSHWHECTCGAKTDVTAHSGGTATCNEQAKCGICGTAYGELADHSFSADWIYDDTSHWHAATCGHDAVSDTAEHSYGNDRTCDICLYTKPAPYIPPSEPTWRPDVDCGENGDVTVSPRYPEQGDRVTITTDPDKGYEVDEVIVTDRRGDEVRVTDNGDGTYRFRQPYGKVTITVTFKKEVCSGGADCPIGSFTDLDFGAWYHDGIHYCVEQGLMQGVGGDSFDPNGTTSRAMIWTILARLDGVDTDGEVWYEAGRKWAVENAISDGTMANDPITREQLATILWRYAKYKGYDVSVGENTNILSYEDAFDISEYAIPAMQWACGAGVIGGIEKNNSMYLDPQGSATRAQAATMIMRFCEMKK